MTTKPAAETPATNDPKAPKLIDVAVAAAHLATLETMHRCAKSARLRIQDSRAREAMAIFEHELAREITDLTRKEPLRS